jgi:hypothetical protein
MLGSFLSLRKSLRRSTEEEAEGCEVEDDGENRVEGVELTREYTEGDAIVEEAEADDDEEAEEEEEDEEEEEEEEEGPKSKAKTKSLMACEVPSGNKASPSFPVEAAFSRACCCLVRLCLIEAVRNKGFFVCC